jgi:hypothetical protein
MPVLGSMVQKGKLAACAVSPPVRALKRVLFPTFGIPTIPVLSFIDGWNRVDTLASRWFHGRGGCQRVTLASKHAVAAAREPVHIYALHVNTTREISKRACWFRASVRVICASPVPWVETRPSVFASHFNRRSIHVQPRLFQPNETLPALTSMAERSAKPATRRAHSRACTASCH